MLILSILILLLLTVLTVIGIVNEWESAPIILFVTAFSLSWVIRTTIEQGRKANTDYQLELEHYVDDYYIIVNHKDTIDLESLEEFIIKDNI